MSSQAFSLIHLQRKTCFAEFCIAARACLEPPRSRAWAFESAMHPIAMSLSSSPSPPGGPWLRAAYRPSPQEIEAYAQIIADAEGVPDQSETARLLDEAELQLWAWRTENRRRDARSRRAPPSGESLLAVGRSREHEDHS